MVNEISEHVSEVYPLLAKEGRAGGVWSGLMPFSEDGSPIVGPVAVKRSTSVVQSVSSRSALELYPGLWVAGTIAKTN